MPIPEKIPELFILQDGSWFFLPIITVEDLNFRIYGFSIPV